MLLSWYKRHEVFTYQKYPQFNIPTMINHLDGRCLPPLKDLLRVHRGIGVEMKRKFVSLPINQTSLSRITLF